MPSRLTLLPEIITWAKVDAIPKLNPPAWMYDETLPLEFTQKHDRYMRHLFHNITGKWILATSQYAYNAEAALEGNLYSPTYILTFNCGYQCKTDTFSVYDVATPSSSELSSVLVDLPFIEINTAPNVHSFSTSALSRALNYKPYSMQDLQAIYSIVHHRLQKAGALLPNYTGIKPLPLKQILAAKPGGLIKHCRDFI